MQLHESHDHAQPKKQVHKSHNPTWQPNYLVNNKKHTQEEKYMQKTILARSWQDHPTARTQDMTPTNVRPPSPTSTPLVLQDEVQLAKTKSHLPRIKE